MRLTLRFLGLLCIAVVGVAQARPVPLKLLTYNTFLLRADANGKETVDARLAALPAELAATDADVIFLQEVWKGADRLTLLREMTRRGYRVLERETHSWYPPYFLGSGLMTLVKSSYRVVGTPTAVVFRQTRGKDWLARKGILKARIVVPGLGTVDLFNAHTSYLPFDRARNDFDNRESAKLLSQITQLQRLILASDADVKILGADVNTDPNQWDAARGRYFAWTDNRPDRVYTLLTTGSRMQDLATPAYCRSCASWDNERNSQIVRGVRVEGGEDISGFAPTARVDYLHVGGARIDRATTRLAFENRHLLRVAGRPLRREPPRLGGPAPVPPDPTERLHLSDHFGIVTDVVLDR